MSDIDERLKRAEKLIAGLKSANKELGKRLLAKEAEADDLTKELEEWKDRTNFWMGQVIEKEQRERREPNS